MADNILNNRPCFDLKSTSLPTVFLELYYFDDQDFEVLLQEKIGKAPNFLRDAPLVIDLDKFKGVNEEINFFTMMGTCRRHSLHIFGVKASKEAHILKAKSAGLAIVRSTSESESPIEEKAEDQSQPSANLKVDAPKSVLGPAKIISQPVRSGQQIQAPDGDLIILGPVQAGAEILAAGNIHVYGPLRGRALAGIHGDESARVFCQSLEAELISIAGQYQISEDLQGDNWKAAVHLHIENGHLIVQSLPSN